ncbi:MAG: DNA polymerase ligase N-terminal domain-containing protein [Lapillicoccus sp.]
MTDEQGRPTFVLHDHRKPQPHYDLRLEEDGVLRSWAVPKGLPTTPKQNRLAIAVDDHDLDHLTYTDETKLVADTGWWEEERREERRIVFVLHGRQGPRRYALIQTEGDGFAARGRPAWLLHLSKDQPPGP